jgi:hypothetical protein
VAWFRKPVTRRPHDPPSVDRSGVGKDTNFRGLTIFNNVVCLTKGSGSNGINTRSTHRHVVPPYGDGGHR